MFASEVSKTDAGLTVVREIDGGLETINITLPAVLSAGMSSTGPDRGHGVDKISTQIFV